MVPLVGNDAGRSHGEVIEMVHYAVGLDGKVLDARSSKSHARQVYTHAVVAIGTQFKNWDGTLDEPATGIMSYHSSEALAQTAARGYRQARVGGELRVVPVVVTERRAKVGSVLLRTGDTLVVAGGQVLRHVDADGNVVR